MKFLSLHKFWVMENIENLKRKLVEAIDESSNLHLIENLWKVINAGNESNVAESPSIYKSEKPMTEEEVEDYFREEVVVLPKEIKEILKVSENQIQNGESYSNVEVEKYFEEWLKD